MAAGCAGLGEASNGAYKPSGSGGVVTLPPGNAGDKYVAVGTNPFVTTDV